MGWIKKFIDGSIISEPSSWSKTKLDNMICCELHHKDKSLIIEGLGEYWQSDTFIAPSNSNRSTLIKRRIMCKFNNPERATYTLDNKFIKFSTLNNNITNIISKDMWLVLEINVINNKFTWYLNKEKV